MAKKDPESWSKSGGDKGVRVVDKAGERRPRMLADWLRTRRVESPTKGKKGAGGAVAAGLAGGGKGLVTGVDVTADMTGKIYRDLKKPMASG